MPADFAGQTAALYRLFRRDLPADQAAATADRIPLRADDHVIDLGCGTGQLAVPLADHCAGIVAVDPEPAMLEQLSERDAVGVRVSLGTDRDLGRIAARIGAPVGAVVIGNALHWMDEPAVLRSAAAVVRPGGAVCVVTQGPPLWLGTTPWQRTIREVLVGVLGEIGSGCRTDDGTLAERAELARSLGLQVRVQRWVAHYRVDIDWVVGHLGSAMSARQRAAALPAVPDALEAMPGAPAMTECVETTVLLANVAAEVSAEVSPGN